MKPGLRDYAWRIFYGPSDDRLKDFYIPALSHSIRYDRSAGYFTSTSIAIAAAGVAHLIRNGGRMRLLVGARLTEGDVRAIEEGYDLREQIEHGLLQQFVDPTDYLVTERLKALAWMVARGTLDIKVVLPVDRNGKPIRTGLQDPYYHIKTGVFTDEAGDQVAFTGSVNDSETAWRINYEDLAVYTSWPTAEGDTRIHLKGVVHRFERLWNGDETDWKALPIPQAVLDKLIRYAPPEPPTSDPLEPTAPEPETDETKDQDERILFRFVRDVPHLPTSRGLAAATTTLRPWPHQTRVADTVVSRYPEGFLLCDEVGLGKTIEAGLILRQLVLDGRVRRAMILTPKSIAKQFQEELFEKFILDVPIFDGRAYRFRNGREALPLTPNPWDGEDLFIVSSQLAKRRERRDEVLSARAFDLVIVDEAHHARRREFGPNLDQFRPNNLLSLLTQLRERESIRCLLLMTATPLQIHPVEVFDLLRLLGLGGRWGAHHSNFLNFFTELRKAIPSDIDWPFVLRMVDDAQKMGVRLADHFAKAAEAQIGPVEWHRVRSLVDSAEAASAFSGLTPEGKLVAREMARHLTPLKRILQRSTRDLLRKYRERGILKEPICRRDPRPVWIPFTPEESRLYEDIETYISDFYGLYEEKRKGLGFVMTIYRRRLTSTFRSLERSLERRLEFLRGRTTDPGLDDDDTEQDDLDLDINEDDQQSASALFEEEIDYVERFLDRIRGLPSDSKLKRLLDDLKEVLRQRETVLIFTQYTDTLDYLRDNLKEVYGTQVACYSGRGGELWDGSVWKPVTKEEIKTLFRAGSDVKIMLGTEAMSEGLNLQTCGVLINFDMPWNPMRVEQRIGRIDRIGQQHEVVWIRNYFYEDSIEATVYRRLESRIDWFETVVGHLQPILAEVGKVIQTLSMTAPTLRASSIEPKIRELEAKIHEAEVSGLNLDEYVEMDVRAEAEIPDGAPVAELERLFLESSLAPLFKPHPSIQGAHLLEHDGAQVVVTFKPDLFDRLPDSLRLLTFGEPLLGELLAKVPEPGVAEDRKGRLIRCESEQDQVAAYLAPSAEAAVPLPTLSFVRGALKADPVLVAIERVAEAEATLRQEAYVLRAQSRGVREALAVGDFLARKEEARIILRRATLVGGMLQQLAGNSLFDGTPFGTAFPPVVNDVRDFARSKGFPYAPLLRLLDNEEIPIAPTDPYLLGLGGRSEKSLRRLESSLRDQAQDIVKRLTGGRNLIAKITGNPDTASGVSASVLR